MCGEPRCDILEREVLETARSALVRQLSIRQLEAVFDETAECVQRLRGDRIEPFAYEMTRGSKNMQSGVSTSIATKEIVVGTPVA